MKAAGVCAAALLLLLPSALLPAAAQSPTLRFTSRAGWTLLYPADWRVSSCRSCPDPAAPGVFVNFLPPRGARTSGWVMVQPLLHKPAGAGVRPWLVHVASTANVAPHVRERLFSLNGAPALRVLYRGADQISIETVYVVSGSSTTSIELTGGPPGIPVDRLPSYPVFQSMVAGFQTNNQAGSH